MSDTTETVSLRDALVELLRERRHDFNITYEEDADAVLDLLRAHRTETLEALGGSIVGEVMRDPSHNGRWWLLPDAAGGIPNKVIYPENRAPVWVFREASE